MKSDLFKINGAQRYFWFFVLTAITTTLFQNCQPQFQASIPRPVHGLTSPFAQNKLVLSKAFLAKSQVTANGSGSGQNSVIPSGSSLTFILNDACMQSRYALPKPKVQYFIDKYLNAAYYQQPLGKIPETAINIALKSQILFSDLERVAQTDDCIIGITNAQQYYIAGSGAPSPINYNDPGYSAQQPYLSQINFPQADAYFAQSIPSSVKVNVAVIDTGFDLHNEDIGLLSPIMVGSNMVGGNDLPQDSDGHGTSVASIITAKGNNAKGIVGIASRNTTLLPIRLFAQAITNKNPKIDATQVFAAVKLAVNAGAEVINMSFVTDAGDVTQDSDNTMSCDILTGYAVFRGIEGGSFFTIAAGQWTSLDKSSNPIPGPVTPPTENGPLPVGLNSMLSCWGRYYKGALTVGALQTQTQTLASISNWGSSGVEIAAPGTSLETYGLNNKLIQLDGTSMSSAEVAAAAALTIAFHKAQGWPYSPWLIEDVLLNGSATSATLQSPVDGRAVHDGKMLDLNALSAHLQQLLTETPAQRLQEPSEDPENGVIFQGGNGPPSPQLLSKLELYTDTPLLQSTGANRAQMQLLAYYYNASFEVITEMAGVTYSVSDPAKASISAQGVLVPAANATGAVGVTATYNGKTASATVNLTTANVLTGETAAITGLNFAIGTLTSYNSPVTLLPFPSPANLRNLCPVPAWVSTDFPELAATMIGQTAAPVIDLSLGQVNPNWIKLSAQYSDGSNRSLGGVSSLSPVTTVLTNPDGSANQDDLGGSTSLLTALYRGQAGSFSVTHAKLSANAVTWDGSTKLTVTRGNQIPTSSLQVQTTGSCDTFVLVSIPGLTVLNGQLQTVTNPVFSNYNFFPNANRTVQYSSPQKALNDIINTFNGGNFPSQITVGDTLPAGTYQVNAVVTYRGSGAVQTLTAPTLTFTLVDNLPSAVVLAAGNTYISASPFGSTAYSGISGWATQNQWAAALKLADGTIVSVPPYNFSWVIKDPKGNPVSQGASNPSSLVWADVGTTTGGANNDSVHFYDFTGAPGDVYTATVTETTTGLSATLPVTIIGTQATLYAGPYSNSVTPSLTASTPVPPSPTPNSYCNTNNSQAQPFAGGSGTVGDPYTICSAAQFLAIGHLTNFPAYLSLKQNLDFSSFPNLSTQQIISRGEIHLDGGYFEIQNWTATDSEAPTEGIFSQITAPSVIANLIIRNPNIQGISAGALAGDPQIGGIGTGVQLNSVYVLGGSVIGRQNVGGLIGNLAGDTFPTLNQIYVLGTSLGSNSGGGSYNLNALGGIIGNFAGLLENSGAEVTINNIGVPGSMSNVGGLIGHAGGNYLPGAAVVSCYSKGTIRGATDNVGGLIGATSISVIHSASSVDVGAQGTSAGGLIGTSGSQYGGSCLSVWSQLSYAPPSIYSSLATGRVWGGTSNAGGSQAGGLIGTLACSIVQNSQATGTVTGVSNVGGLVGMESSQNIIMASSSLGAVSASTGVVGGFGGIKQLTDSHLVPSTYASDAWSAANNSTLSGYGSWLGKTNINPAGISAK